MSETHQFEIVDDIAVYRPRGRVSLEQAFRMVKSAIASARDQQLRGLLVVASELEGFESPSVASRHFFSREWAGAGNGVVRIALVVKAEMIDPEKFGVIVARNFGASADVFTSEIEALAWLRSNR